MQALQGQLTVNTLQQLEKNLDVYWRNMCGKIRFLDKRIEMILGVKNVEDIISSNAGVSRPYADVLYKVRLALATLDMEFGTYEIQRMLEAMPLPLIAAVAGVHELRDDWLGQDGVDELEYVSNFFTLLSTCQQTLYGVDKDGIPCFCFDTCREQAMQAAIDAGVTAQSLEQIMVKVDEILDDLHANMVTDVALEDEALALVEVPAE